MPQAAPPKAAAVASPGPVAPPGLQEMDQDIAALEVSLDEQILAAEAEVKQLKGSKSEKRLGYLAQAEASLQQLRDQQRKERPLPARLQSATHRLEKEGAGQLAATAAVASAKVVVTDAVASLVALEALLVEADVKVMEAQGRAARCPAAVCPRPGGGNGLVLPENLAAGDV